MSSVSDTDESKSRFERIAGYLLDATVLERIGIAVGSTVFALAIGLVIVALAGYNPFRFATQLVVGAFGSERAIARTLRFSTLFVLAGLAVAVAFRAGVFNIGVQGQFIVGGMACVMSIIWTAPYLPTGVIGGVILIGIGIASAVVSGGLYGALPGALKAYADANEIITTIMLNFIAIGVVGWLVNGPLRGEDARSVRTEQLPDYVAFPQVVFSDPNFSVVGFGIAVLAVVSVAFVLTRTRYGYDMVTSGYQATAARFSGVDSKRTIVATMTLSGMIAGLTGAIFVVMIQGSMTDPGGNRKLRLRRDRGESVGGEQPDRGHPRRDPLRRAGIRRVTHPDPQRRPRPTDQRDHRARRAVRRGSRTVQNARGSHGSWR